MDYDKVIGHGFSIIWRYKLLWLLGSISVVLFIMTLALIRPVSATASLSLTPTSGPPGSLVSATGSGFQGGEVVKLRWGTLTGPVLTTTTTDLTGSFSGVVFIAPTASPGTYNVWAIGQTSDNYATATFDLQGSLTPTPTTPTSTATPTPTALPTTTPHPTPTTDYVYLPLVLRSEAAGTILSANSGPAAHDVTEINRQGQIVWQYTNLNNPVDAERLPSGNTLIADAGHNRVIEVNRSKEIVWVYPVNLPLSARRLANDNTLITVGAPSKVLEVTPGGTIAWSYDFTPYCQQHFCQGTPQDAIRLPNGNTLVALADAGIGLIEVDTAGSIVLQHKVVSAEGTGLRLYSVQELLNGHWLVTGSGLTIAQVVELKSTGEQVWYYGPPGFCDECLYLPRDAVRTTRGTTLIADYGKDRILEVNTTGQIVWRYERAGSGPWSIREVPAR